MKRLYMKQYFDALHCVTVFGKTIFKNIEKGLSDNINNCHSFFYKPNRKEAFTLAETIITLSIIGIIAVITIPSLIVGRTESEIKTKFKKAMAVYEKAMTTMVVKNRIMGNKGLYGQNGFAPLGTCERSIEYFKITEKLADGNCRFKTADGIFWDISNINKVIVARSARDLNTQTADSDSNKAFYLISEIDSKGSLRINDLAYETGTDKADLTRFYDYVFGKTSSATNVIEDPKNLLTKCFENNQETCPINDIDYTKVEWSDNSYDGMGCWMWHYYNDYGDMCDYLSQESKIEEGTYYYADIGSDMTWDEGKATCESLGGDIANTAQLQQLYYEGKLDYGVNYFTSELLFGDRDNWDPNEVNREVVFYSAVWEGISAGAMKSDGLNILCVIKM